VPITVTPEQVERRVVELLCEIGIETEGISAQTRLEAIDVESLDLVEVAHVVHKEHGVKLTGDDVKDVVTVGDFVQAFLANAG
jgi:acyl carrier protein